MPCSIIASSNLIGSGLLARLRHPAQLARLRAEPELTGSAIEEFLRYDGPGQRFARLALEEVQLGGARLNRSDVVLLGLGAANRDPAHFTDPDALDITRQPNKHLAFGHGIHSVSARRWRGLKCRPPSRQCCVGCWRCSWTRLSLPGNRISLFGD